MAAYGTARTSAPGYFLSWKSVSLYTLIFYLSIFALFPAQNAHATSVVNASTTVVNPGAGGGARHKRFRPETAWRGACARGKAFSDKVSSSGSA